jgi:predicted nucleic acid-binding protein
MRFWDASAVIPLCLKEPLSSVMKKTAEEDEALVAWWGTPVECWSAFARWRRDGELEPDGEEQARRLLSLLAERWTEIQAGNEVRENAARVLLLHPLRAADALQLSAALAWARGHATGHDFVCLDRRLRDAARREGFRILPESRHLP